ncbi:MAG: protein kinase domain-containing protein, partial [Candidatus Eiseniibacteriota bacterium]
NIMLLPDGRLKILDFGLAKQAPVPKSESMSQAGTVVAQTDAGFVIGTVGYMSPEQVRGLAVDARSDIFSLGAVLYEMLSGKRAFRGESPADTMSSILREEPADLHASVRDLPTALDRILRRCLEKRPDDRFRSAHDLAIALEAISTTGRVEAITGEPQARSASSLPKFQRLTFRNGNISSARFADDGRSIIYGAAWEGKPFEIYSSRPESPESRSLGLPPGDLHAISSTGEMALSLGHRHTYWFEVQGTLARASLGGGGVRLLLEGVARADWSPDGKSLAVVRPSGGRYRLEYPAGTVLHETVDWCGLPRVSRDGARVAFADYGTSGDTSGRVCLVDRERRVSVLAERMTSVTGVCWSPDGTEVWYSGINFDLEVGIWAVTAGGPTRKIYSSPSRIRLHDVAANGRLLMSTEKLNLGAIVGGDDSSGDLNLSWFDASLAADLSSDGTQLLFTEVADAENPHYAVYLRATDGSAAVRLGDGMAKGISPDGKWVLAIPWAPEDDMVIFPTGLGVSRSLRSPEIDRYVWAGWHPNGEEIFLVGTTKERARRLYRQSISGGGPRLILDEEIDFDWIMGLAISHDGKRILLPGRGDAAFLLNVDSGAREPVPSLKPDDMPVRFDLDSRHLFVARTAEHPPRIERVELSSGARSLVRELRPPEPSGIVYIGGVVATPDGTRHAYSFLRSLSDLYLVEGIG